MVRSYRREGRTDEWWVLPPWLLVARWVAYGLMLVSGILLFGVLPSRQAPETPPPMHQHTVGAARSPVTVWWAPILQHPSIPQEPSARAGAHLHSGFGRAPNHGVHTRLSPRRLSLAKW